MNLQRWGLPPKEARAPVLALELPVDDTQSTCLGGYNQNALSETKEESSGEFLLRP